MDNIKKNDQETVMSKIKKIKEEFPDLKIPTMGIIDVKDDVDIDGREYFKQKSVRED